MKNLNTITRSYLADNGLKISYFASWIGCDRVQVSLWLNGKRDLPAKYTRRVLDFISGEHLKGADLAVGSVAV